MKRVVLKLSGEALGKPPANIDLGALSFIAREIRSALKLRVQLAIVIGGGNIWRGARDQGLSLERAISDTNTDPDLVDYPIPGNDDAIRAIKLITSMVADAIEQGRNDQEQILAQPESEAPSGDEVAETADTTAPAASESPASDESAEDASVTSSPSAQS